MFVSPLKSTFCQVKGAPKGKKSVLAELKAVSTATRS